jgi:dihydroneopterin aldolase
MVGVLPQEHLQPQELIISLEVESSNIKVQRDAIDATLDYVALKEICEHAVTSSHHQLIETKAQVILDALHTAFPSLTGAKVRIEKPGALPGARCAFVEMYRQFL